MGRFFMYAAIGALALFVVATYSIVEHGGGKISAVQQLSVHQLTSAAPAYQGGSVTTTGLLSYSEEHEWYELVDDANYAVVIRNYDDEESLAGLLGALVTVAGEFNFDDEIGTYIDATSIHLADPSTPEPE